MLTHGSMQVKLSAASKMLIGSTQFVKKIREIANEL